MKKCVKKKLYQVTRGHSQGEIEAIFLMITSHGIYVMTRLEVGTAAANTERVVEGKTKIERER